MEASAKTSEHYSELLHLIQFFQTVSFRLCGLSNECEVYEVLKSECAKSEVYSICVFLFTGNKRYLKVQTAFVPGNETLINQAGEITGEALDTYRIDVRKSPFISRVVVSGKTITMKVPEIIKDLFPPSKAPILIKLFNCEDKMSIITPLVVGGGIAGALLISSQCLLESFSPAVIIFATHISASIELAHECLKRRKSEDRYRVLVEKKNIAFKEVLDQIELEKKQVEEAVVKNIDKLILPLLHELECKISTDKDIFKLLKRNLSKITSSYGRQISLCCSNLSQRELEICNMVKNGLSNKDIAKSLGLSLLTVEKHRHRIRKKFGITNEKINLSRYLQTL